jgi:hypothetical protein
VHSGEIVVTQPDHGFCAVYTKPPHQPQLVLKHRAYTNDHVLMARTWEAANAKARDLGWIV